MDTTIRLCNRFGQQEVQEIRALRAIGDDDLATIKAFSDVLQPRLELLAAANHCERLIWLFWDMGLPYEALASQ